MTSIEQSIIKFNVDPEINRIKCYYNSDNYWKVLGIERKECEHSAFLKWLLDFERGASPQPRNQFLNLLLAKCPSPDHAMQQNEMDDFKNAILLDDYKITSWTSELEKPIKELCNIRYTDRIDIYINCKVEIGKKTYNLEIVIENKVESGEGKCKKKDTLKDTTKTQEEIDYFKKETQTKRYYDALSNPKLRKISPAPDIQFFIFLAGKQKPTEEKFINVTYQDLVDYIIEPQLKNGLDDYSNFILNDYLKNLSGNPYNKKLSTMAITNNEKELLLSFYKKNEQLFMRILEVAAEYTCDEDEKELIKNAVESLKDTKMVKRRYTISVANKNHPDLKMYQVLEYFTNFRLGNGRKITEINTEIQNSARTKNCLISNSQDKVYRSDKHFHKFKSNVDNQTYFITKELRDDDGGNFRRIKEFINK